MPKTKARTALINVRTPFAMTIATFTLSRAHEVDSAQT
jgi:hypothetical protein